MTDEVHELIREQRDRATALIYDLRLLILRNPGKDMTSELLERLSDHISNQGESA